MWPLRCGASVSELDLLWQLHKGLLDVGVQWQTVRRIYSAQRRQPADTQKLQRAEAHIEKALGDLLQKVSDRLMQQPATPDTHH